MDTDMWNVSPSTRPPLGALLVLALAAEAGSGQERRPPPGLRHIQSVRPASGPVGTPVTVHTKNLPLQARVYVAVGALHDGFEVLAEATQGELGEVTATIRIPETAAWDRPLVLVILDAIFRPIGMSDPFHVTSAEGLVRRYGTIAGGEAPCITIRDEGGYLYELAGDLGPVEPGQEVVVEGVLSERGACEAASAIRVTYFSTDPV